ncbi:MAG: FAD-dependent oxidoreductase [Lachnospiraceae bacterium]|nr:FAD-dependent oxidoreductase [Lachnospiraceae bacterium]
MKYVIIGNSAAAAGAVEGIREIDKDGEIVIISNEEHHVYSRPLISYLLQGKTDEQKMKYRSDDFYEVNSCKLMLGKTATKIDASKKEILLDDGKSVSYDKLLVATGSSPFVPPMNGLENVSKKFCFMTLDSAKALEKELGETKKVLIIGGGLIGLKCAEGIAMRVGKITIVDLSTRILSSILDETGAKLVQSHLEKQGMDFILGTSVEHFDGNTAYLTNGDKIDFDILVTAIGVKPNIGLVKDAGGKVGRGIEINNKMETSLEGIYSAGDCVESFDISSGANKILAIMPNAYKGGKTAGTNMADGNAEFDNAMPMNAIGFFGLHVITAGSYEGKTFESKCGEDYKKLFYDESNLKGFILVGNVDKAGIYTYLIRERVPLSSLDFGLICKQPSLIAFSRGYRDEKLGGILHEN